MQKIDVFILIISLAMLPTMAQAACNVIDGKSYGDCSGVTVRNGEKQSLHVRSTIQESSIIAGATVYPGGHLHLSGISNGDIVVKRGGKLTISGVVNGAVRNEGGQIEIEGIVEHLSSNGGMAFIGGQVGSFSGTGPAQFKKGAILQGQPLMHPERLPKQP